MYIIRQRQAEQKYKLTYYTEKIMAGVGDVESAFNNIIQAIEADCVDRYKREVLDKDCDCIDICNTNVGDNCDNFMISIIQHEIINSFLYIPCKVQGDTEYRIFVYVLDASSNFLVAISDKISDSNYEEGGYYDTVEEAFDVAVPEGFKKNGFYIYRYISSDDKWRCLQYKQYSDIAFMPAHAKALFNINCRAYAGRNDIETRACVSAEEDGFVFLIEYFAGYEKIWSQLYKISRR